MTRWPSSDRLNLLLVALTILTAWGPLYFHIFDSGCDIVQFYLAGGIVNRGEADRLYDQAHFQDLEQAFVGDWLEEAFYYSLYPPIVAVIAAPWAHLPFTTARVVWWIAETLGFGLAGWMLYRSMRFAPKWRATAVLSLLTLFPVWMALRVGQLTPLWLTAIFGGLLLGQRGQRLGAGMLLSILACKPQLAAPVFFWLVLRRDLRTLGGVAAGLALQTVVVMAVLGPAMPLYYLQELPHIGKAAKSVSLSAAYEHSLAGTLNNILWSWDWPAGQREPAAMLGQMAMALLAAGLLWRAVQANRRLQRLRRPPAEAQHYEYACAVLFLVLATPHLLLYDVALLAMPMVWLWSSSDWRLGIVLYLSMTVVAAFCYLGLGFSLVPFVALWILSRLANRLCEWQREAAPDRIGVSPCQDAVGFSGA